MEPRVKVVVQMEEVPMGRSTAPAGAYAEAMWARTGARRDDLMQAHDRQGGSGGGSRPAAAGTNR